MILFNESRIRRYELNSTSSEGLGGTVLEQLCMLCLSLTLPRDDDDDDYDDDDDDDYDGDGDDN